VGKLRVGIIDLVTITSPQSIYDFILNGSFSSIMPQVVAAWCEEAGHEVFFTCYAGASDFLNKKMPNDVDIVFIGSFSRTAQMAYAISNYYRSAGAVTALGGPHARCFPNDALRYFDYVLGFTDRAVIRDILQDCTAYRPMGIYVTAREQPRTLAGVRERYRFIRQPFARPSFIKVVPMISSFGCPYTCSFCIDADVPYSRLDLDQIKDDLRFLLKEFGKPRVGWHDPNFGVNFNEVMDAIEEAVPPGSIDFMAECSLSILSEANLRKLRRNGFKVIVAGIESWYCLGNKANAGKLEGIKKVKHVSEHINSILRHVPVVQTNFVFGLDSDAGPEPFELTKKFVDLTPGAFPAYCMLTSFGRAAPINAEYYRQNRVLPIPFHFLSNWNPNVKPKNYSWTEFYDRVLDVTKYTFSWSSMIKRYRANQGILPAWINVLRATSPEGFGRIQYYSEVRRRLSSDRHFRAFFDQETTELPGFYVERVRRELGRFWEWLPDGALYYDPDR
jgi:hypothetical protein